MRTRLAVARIAAVMVVLLTVPIAAIAEVGPSFPCPQPDNPLANLICSSPELSHDDLKMVQAYQALRFSLPGSGRDELTEESIAFTAAVTTDCGIPARRSGLSAPRSAIPCVDRRYRQQRDVYAARLTGAPAQEADRTLAQHIALQQDLQTLGFLLGDAAIDGDYGPVTRAAIEAWQQSRGLTMTGFLGDNDASRLAAEAGNNAPAPANGGAAPAETKPTPPMLSSARPVAPAAGPEETQPSTVDAVPLAEENGTFVVPVQINGAITLGFVVDSGAADVQIPIDVFSTLVRAKTIDASDLMGEQTYVLADGSTQDEPRFIVRELKVGNYTFRNVPASVSPAAGALLLGQSFLSRFARWTLDNQQHVLRLVEKSAQQVPRLTEIIGATERAPAKSLGPVRQTPALSPPGVSSQPAPLATAAMPAVPHQRSAAGVRFQIATCGSILDTATHLEWYLGPDVNITWSDAEKWIQQLRACNETWTMPSIDQLKTLFDRNVTAGIGYFTGGRHWPAHIDPVFAGIGKGSWAWARGPQQSDEAPAFNFNQGVEVEIPSTEFYGTVRVFAVRQTHS